MEWLMVKIQLMRDHPVVAYFLVTGAINSFVAGAKVMGWTRMADECLKIEDAIGAAVSAWRNRPQPPADGSFGKMAVILVLMMSMACAGCASVSYKGKDGQEMTYSRVGSQSIKGMSIEQTENGLKMTVESAQSDTQALSSAVASLSSLAVKAPK